MEILQNLLGSNTNVDIALTVLSTWILVQVIKPLLKSHTKYIPLLAVAIGGLSGALIALNVANASVLDDCVLGIVAGFASTGLNETFTKSFTSVLSAFCSKITDIYTAKTSTTDATDTTKQTK